MNRQSSNNKNFFVNTKYFDYIVQYQGDIESEFSNYPDYFLTIINTLYAILSVPEMIEDITSKVKFKTIVYIKPFDVYTLQEISPLEASQANFLQLNLPLTLSGKGVLVAVIDTGIDYLSEEFMDANGNTRIEYLWDQSAEFNSFSSNAPKEIIPPFGALYTKKEIQDAINLSKSGGDPYTIVPSKDEIGHGTQMSGLIGATGKNPNLKGVVPDCRFIVVKLIEDYTLKKLYTIDTPMFNVALIFAAIEFIFRYALEIYTPVVVYLPLGTTLGSHKGTNILERYIDAICINSGIVFVTGAGNQRFYRGHSSGNLTVDDPIKIIDLDVAPEQKILLVEVWVDIPNIVSIDIISPSGENTGTINYIINTTTTYNFVFEKTTVKVTYFIPEENAGAELIRVQFSNLQPGTWKLRLVGEIILDGSYNAWLPPRGITLEGTYFIPSDPYGTVTTPGNSRYIITAAAYNQNNNNMVNYSGVAFSSGYIDVINVAAGGVNALTVSPGNKTAVVNGTSVAAAIVAGACAMIFEWGMIQGNNPNLYSQTIKTYLSRGVSVRPGDIYPNPQWGYGILNIFNLFKNI